MSVTETIVVGVDGSASSERALRWAAAEAARWGMPLRVVHVAVPWIRTLPSRLLPSLERPFTGHGEHILERARGLVSKQHPDVPVEARFAHAETVAAGLPPLAECAYELVLGSRGLGGFSGLLLGSTGLRLAGHVPGPVILVRGPEERQSGEVVAGLDLKEDPAPVPEYAFAAASVRGARVRAVHAWRPAPLAVEAGVDLQAVRRAHREHLTELLAPWRERRPGIGVVEDDFISHPVDALIGASAHADLVVVGTRGRSGPALGSVSHGVVHYAHCPVAVVRPRKA